MDITNEELIEKAKSVVKPKKMKYGFTIADCGSALLTEDGNVYLGASIATPSGINLCSEQSAMATMITKGEFKIKKIVTVDESGVILPPCGTCREAMYQIDQNNLETDVIIKKDITVKLKDLLPYLWDESL
ncbi:MAG: cytidine deaminase [Candidatus Daviesbacteria bacterium]|nr:cytidine deaminase [Candidatus Daviesbacteria bacterium]